MKSFANWSRASITSTSTAPAARARSLIVSLSPGFSCPTSTAHATTSTSHSSRIHRTAIDVSSPPEYASTTRLGSSLRLCSDTRALETREGGEGGRDRGATDRFPASRGTGCRRRRPYPRMSGRPARSSAEPTTCALPGRRAQHDDVRAVRDLEHELAQQPLQVIVGAVRSPREYSGIAYAIVPPGMRTFTAPSSSRSRLTVACVATTPSASSSCTSCA